MTQIFEKAYSLSMNNEVLLKSARVCGCFYCHKVMETSAIKTFTKIPAEVKVLTAKRFRVPPVEEFGSGVCPDCRREYILPEISGIVISEDLLKRLSAFWFGL